MNTTSTNIIIVMTTHCGIQMMISIYRLGEHYQKVEDIVLNNLYKAQNGKDLMDQKRERTMTSPDLFRGLFGIFSTKRPTSRRIS